jgi:hypothetical protein
MLFQELFSITIFRFGFRSLFLVADLHSWFQNGVSENGFQKSDSQNLISGIIGFSRSSDNQAWVTSPPCDPGRTTFR